MNRYTALRVASLLAGYAALVVADNALAVLERQAAARALVIPNAGADDLEPADLSDVLDRHAPATDCVCCRTGAAVPPAVA